ncbi:MAG: pyridoxamine 5'-phosphate oxidase family protein [Acidimicrobiia bacterium]|nr:pyridoxamine 5'-phosphate oxidase family protein [Acidimicrobiia bacterium]
MEEQAGLEVLSEEECARLLATSHVGRVAVTMGALPAVVPVNYALLDGDVVFRTGKGTRLATATTGTVVAFEVDRVDAEERSGWSVLVVGMADQITDPDELESALGLGLRPWAPGDRDHFVRVAARRVSGRRLAAGGENGSLDGERRRR